MPCIVLNIRIINTGAGIKGYFHFQADDQRRGLHL